MTFRQCRAGPLHPQLLSQAELLSFADQIAKGMAYLEQNKIAHGDLCAFG